MELAQLSLWLIDSQTRTSQPYQDGFEAPLKVSTQLCSAVNPSYYEIVISKVSKVMKVKKGW
jgi:hypothetical protein